MTKAIKDDPNRRPRRLRLQRPGPLGELEQRLVDHIRKHLVLHGGVPVIPKDVQMDGKSLSDTTAFLRKLYVAGKLRPELCTALEAIPGWTWRATKGPLYLSLLRAHVERHGWDSVSSSTRIDGHPVGAWLSSARLSHRKGGRGRWRARELESIPGFSWEQSFAKGRARRSKRVQGEHLAIVRVAARKNLIAGVYVKKRSRINGKYVASSVAYFRTKFKRGTLDRAVQRELESIPGWTWAMSDPRAPELDPHTLNRRLLAAIRTRMGVRTGVGLLAPGPKVDGYHVGWRVKALRKWRAKGVLSEEWIDALERIPGWSWGPRRERSLKNVELLRGLVRTRGWKSLASRTVVAGVDLGQWVSSVRCRYRQHGLQAWLREALESIPGWTWEQSHRRAGARMIEKTAARYLALLRRARPSPRTGRIITRGEVGGWRLQSIAHFFRMHHATGRLPPGVAKEVERLSGWVLGQSRDDLHAQKLAALKRFLEERDWEDLHHHPVTDGFNLYQWVQTCRTHRRQGRRQPAWLVEQLERLPNWSWTPKADRAKSRRLSIDEEIQDRRERSEARKEALAAGRNGPSRMRRLEHGDRSRRGR